MSDNGKPQVRITQIPMPSRYWDPYTATDHVSQYFQQLDKQIAARVVDQYFNPEGDGGYSPSQVTLDEYFNRQQAIDDAEQIRQIEEWCQRHPKDPLWLRALALAIVPPLHALHWLLTKLINWVIRD